MGYLKRTPPLKGEGGKKGRGREQKGREGDGRGGKGRGREGNIEKGVRGDREGRWRTYTPSVYKVHIN